jgi:hypothetical protein
LNYFPDMPRVAFFLLFVGAVACGSRAPAPQASQIPQATPRAPEPVEHALSGLAGQHVVLLPLYVVRVAPDLNWAAAVGRTSDFARVVDADIAAAFEEHGLRKTWILPDQLELSYKRNSSYAADPYALAEEPLRASKFLPDSHLPEPIATQLRTLVALHEDTRLVLAPVELRFEKTVTGGQGILRLVLIDPRLNAVRWMGDITSDPVAEFGPVISVDIAAKLARVIATP